MLFAVLLVILLWHV
jgi:hypothetical protein